MKNKTNIILIGMKGSGKTTIGKLLAQKLTYQHIELDQYVEKKHEQSYAENLSPREIFKKHGSEYFRNLEHVTLQNLVNSIQQLEPFVLSVGGGTILAENNQQLLSSLGLIIYLDVERSILLQRITARGIPPFFLFQDNPQKSLDTILASRIPIYEKLANITIFIDEKLPEEIVSLIITKLDNYAN